MFSLFNQFHYLLSFFFGPCGDMFALKIRFALCDKLLFDNKHKRWILINYLNEKLILKEKDSKLFLLFVQLKRILWNHKFLWTSKIVLFWDGSRTKTFDIDKIYSNCLFSSCNCLQLQSFRHIKWMSRKSGSTKKCEKCWKHIKSDDVFGGKKSLFMSDSELPRWKKCDKLKDKMTFEIICRLLRLSTVNFPMNRPDIRRFPPRA